MPDTPFKSMSRETRRGLDVARLLRHGPLVPYPGSAEEAALSVECEKCGGRVYEGDWPFCSGPGRAADHRRD